MTRENVSQQRSVSVVLPIMLKLLGFALAVVVVLVVLACIPQSTPIGVQGSGAGYGTVAALSRTAKHLPRGQMVGRRVSEADLNGFFKGDSLRRMKVDAFTIDITEGAIRVRMVETLGRMDIGSWQLRPRLSTDLTVAPGGKSLRFGRARQGLLPLVGPLKTMAIRRVYQRLAALDEWAICKSIADVQAHGDALDVSLQR
ncbi:MAG: hypothetical protein K8T26_16105 [Lentisphaerae bacterium]|nr:hypothetical protein [Lentisphaerota bacterium]